MATDIKVADNRTQLDTQNTAKKQSAAALATVPKGRESGQADQATKTGDAAWTTIVWNHGLAAAPSNVIISPRTQAAAATAWVSASSATTFTITFAAAPANAAVCTFDYVTYA